MVAKGKKEKQADSEKILCPKAGTATSSPDVLTTSSTILNVMLWIKKEAYEDTTIKATAKRKKGILDRCTRLKACLL